MQARQQLENWAKESIDRWRSLVSERLPNEKSSRFAPGIWFVAYLIRGEPNREELLEILKTIKLETEPSAWSVPT
jgi:hypothetical protein